MTPTNQGRLLRALIATVTVSDETGLCRVELVDLGDDQPAKEAA